jgi:hypothetical protein
MSSQIVGMSYRNNYWFIVHSLHIIVSIVKGIVLHVPYYGV